MESIITENNSQKKIIAIDPGATGVMVIHNNGVLHCERDIDLYCGILKTVDPDHVVVIEQIEPSRGFNNGSSQAKVYGHYMYLIGICDALGYQIVQVPPKEWQKYYGPLPKGMKNYTDRKKVLAVKAREIYSKDVVTNQSMADGFLILNWYLNKQRTINAL